ncbi:MAG: type IV pilus modification protein PilV [Gammaproteobacteria bacterium]|nr:type IV pilus modification protein PilV [Gammaproteobacteria bacterium]
MNGTHFALKQRGLTILEILIALVILAVGLLGVAGLQASALRNNHSAYLKSQATTMVMDMADRIRANPRGATLYAGYDSANAKPEDPGCLNKGCSSSQLSQYDLYEWHQQLTNLKQPLLPGGRGIITLNGDTYSVVILWQEAWDSSTHAQCIADQAADYACFSTNFRL